MQSNAYAEDFEQDEQPTTTSFKEVKAIVVIICKKCLIVGSFLISEGKYQIQKLPR
jgi:hypothetical protein